MTRCARRSSDSLPHQAEILYPPLREIALRAQLAHAVQEGREDDHKRLYAQLVELQSARALPVGHLTGAGAGYKVVTHGELARLEEPQPDMQPAVDDRDQFLLAVFLRRYITWCARTRRYAEMNGAARLHREIQNSRSQTSQR